MCDLQVPVLGAFDLRFDPPLLLLLPFLLVGTAGARKSLAAAASAADSGNIIFAQLVVYCTAHSLLSPTHLRIFQVGMALVSHDLFGRFFFFDFVTERD